MTTPKVKRCLPAFVPLLLALGACRAEQGRSGVKDAVDAAPLPNPPVVEIAGGFGSAAAAVYDAATLDEANDGGTLKKSHAGALSIRCTQTGAPVSGAVSGAPTSDKASASRWSCAVGPTAASPFLRLADDHAREVWQAFHGEAAPRSGGLEKVFEAAEGEFICAHHGGIYRCTAGALGSAAAGGGFGAASGPEVLSLMGGSASAAGVAFKGLPQRPVVVGGIERKTISGRLALRCSEAAPAQISCAASVPPTPSSTGTPAAPFLKLEGAAAKTLWEALAVEAAASPSGGARRKDFTTNAGELSCTRGGNEQYGCSLRGARAP